MLLNNEELASLKSLLDKGAITKKQYDKATGVILISPIVEKIKAKLLTLVVYLLPTRWKADIAWFRTKKLLVYCILGCLIYVGAYAHGYYKTKDVKVPVNANEVIHVLKNGSVQFETKEGKVFHVISKADVNSLQNELKPISLQFKFIGVVGSSFGTGTDKFEGGAGFSWLRAWNVDADCFITNGGIYPLALSYSLKQLHLPNTGIGIGIGKGFKASETKSILYLRVNF